MGAIVFGIIPIAAVLPVFVACTSSLLLSMAFWRTPVVALMPDLTPSEHRSQANGIINFMGGIGSIIAFLIGSKLYQTRSGLPILVRIWISDSFCDIAFAIYSRTKGRRTVRSSAIHV